MTVKKSKKTREREMDGAHFSWDDVKVPSDFLNGADGKRPGEPSAPRGTVKINLKNGIEGRTLPPRFIWNQGEWANDSSASGDWNIWVVDGEGTPGNYKTREYEVPPEIAATVQPKHPADWPKKLQEGGYSYSSGKPSTYSGKSSTPSLPWGLRIRCPNCGHFFKMSELGDHAKNACPATQDQPAMWVIECECHPNDLLASAEVLPGFPVKPPEPKTEEAPDVSGAEQEQEPVDQGDMVSDLEPVKGD